VGTGGRWEEEGREGRGGGGVKKGEKWGVSGRGEGRDFRAGGVLSVGGGSGTGVW